MRATFLSTGTNETNKYADSLSGLGGWEITYLQYDKPALADETLYAQVRDAKPDLIVYIGSRWGKVASPSILAQMRDRIAPTVHICSDAADTPWHDMLRLYHEQSCFALQVAIDGSHKWPLSERGLTMLTPIEPSLFPGEPMPHARRNVLCGYAGNPGAGVGQRTATLSALLERKVIDQLHIRSNLPFTNEMYCRFLGHCRISVNIAYTGTEAALHVKGRVLESAFAGALLLETKGAPTSYWFRPGIDYLEYSTPDEAQKIVRELANEPEKTQAIAFSLRSRALAEHSTAIFWGRIFEHLGMKVAT